MRRRPSTSLLAAAAALALSGCAASSEAAIEADALTSETADDPVEPIGPGGAITVEAFDFGYNVVSGTAVDGPLEITLENLASGQHNIRFDAAVGDNDIVEVDGGATNTGTVQLFGAPGGQAYTFYCDISGHRASGMEGELIVYLDEEEAEGAPLTVDEAESEGDLEG